MIEINNKTKDMFFITDDMIDRGNKLLYSIKAELKDKFVIPIVTAIKYNIQLEWVRESIDGNETSLEICVGLEGFSVFMDDNNKYEEELFYTNIDVIFYKIIEFLNKFIIAK